MMRRLQNGVALIVVLFILTVMVTMSSQMTQRFQIGLKRTANLVSYQQAVSYLLGAESFSQYFMYEQIKSVEVTHLQQFWAKKEHVFPIDGATLRGQITDAHSRFNLNSLGETNAQKREKNARRFLQLLILLDIESSEAEHIVEQTKQWLSRLPRRNAEGSADESDVIYEAKNPPYRPAHQLMFDLSELRAIDGVTQMIYQRVKPFLCVYPGNTMLSVNANTISEQQPEILAALFPEAGDLSVQSAKDILQNRPREGWTSVDSFASILEQHREGPLSDEDKQMFLVLSSEFEADMTINMHDNQLRMRVFLQKDNDNNMMVVKRRIFGGSA